MRRGIIKFPLSKYDKPLADKVQQEVEERKFSYQQNKKKDEIEKAYENEEMD